jgi:hypothetical protein
MIILLKFNDTIFNLCIFYNVLHIETMVVIFLYIFTPQYLTPLNSFVLHSHSHALLYHGMMIL